MNHTSLHHWYYTLALLLLWAYSPLQAASDLPPHYYTLQLGAYKAPMPQQFVDISAQGYVHLEAAGAHQRVLLGQYFDKAAATLALQAVQDKGFPDAFVAQRDITADAMVYSIQLKSFEQYTDIQWADWKAYDQLYLLHSNEEVKLLTYATPDLTLINRQLQELRKNGISGAFIKYINRALLLPAGAFEQAANQPAPHTFNPNDPDNVARGGEVVAFQARGITFQDAKVLTQQQATAPSVIARYQTAQRESVRTLQATLEAEVPLPGADQGVFDEATSDALSSYQMRDPQYARYRLMAQQQLEVTERGSSLQHFVNIVHDNPRIAQNGLSADDHPMAKAYLAYMYFTEKATPPAGSPSRAALVDQLMQAAINGVFKRPEYKGLTPIDLNKTYRYDNIQLLIQHLSLLQDAMQDPPALPCWLFEAHPQEAAPLFGRLYAMVSGCGDFMEWEEYKVLQLVSSALDPVVHDPKNEADAQQLRAYAARRAQLYLAPTVSAGEAQIIETWHTNLWKGLDAWSAQDALHAKWLRPFKVAYFDAMVKTENHFIERGFTPDESRILSISVLRTVVNYHMEHFTKRRS